MSLMFFTHEGEGAESFPTCWASAPVNSPAAALRVCLPPRCWLAWRGDSPHLLIPETSSSREPHLGAHRGCAETATLVYGLYRNSVAVPQES